MSKPTGKPTGRPTKMTDAIIAQISKAISLGLTDQEASDLVGIDDLTLCRWRKIPEFNRRIAGATAKRKMDRLERIEQGLPGWQGAAWSAERANPERFARPEVMIQMNNNNAQPAQNAFFLAGSFTSAVDPTIDGLLRDVPAELSNTPQPDAVEADMTVTPEPTHDNVIRKPVTGISVSQPKDIKGEGTSMKLLRTGYQENRPNLKPKQQVMTARDVAAEKVWQSFEFDSNDPL